jgi:archaellum component FlaC
MIMNLSELKPVVGEQANRLASNAPTEIARERKADAAQLAEARIREPNGETLSLRKPAQVASIVVSERLSSQLNIKSGNQRASIIDEAGRSPNQVVQGERDGKPIESVEVDRFDIQSVAKNVLTFVGAALDKLSTNGASDEQILDKIEAAKEGIKVGFESAIRDLGDLLTDPLKADIDETRKVINDGIEGLGEQYLSKPLEAITQQQDFVALAQSTLFQITTKDGDEISISFSSSQFAGVSNTVFDSKELENEKGRELLAYQGKTQNFELRVTGNLDEDEFLAINDLINKVDDVTSQFFYGDVQNAYEQSVNLGFDQEQLAGFALQLRQSESYTKIRQYGEVKYANDNQQLNQNNNPPKSVAQYMNKMLDVMETSKELLSSEDEYKSIINGLINEMKDVQVPDLVSAINKFYKFTSKLNVNPVSET